MVLDQHLWEDWLRGVAHAKSLSLTVKPPGRGNDAKTGPARLVLLLAGVISVKLRADCMRCPSL